MSEGTLHVRDSRTSREYAIPVRHNSVAASDIKKIKGTVHGSNPADKVANGLRVYDPTLFNTAIVESNMTWIDGERGTILFRGYSLEQLYEKDFEDALHLLAWQELPSPSQKEALRRTLALAMAKVPKSVFTVIKAFPKSAPPMSLVIAGLTAYIAEDPDLMPAHTGNNIYHKNAERVDKAIIDTVAAVGAVVAIADCHTTGTKFTPPSTARTFYENLFTMMGRVDASTGRPDPTKLSCFRRWGTAIMDHGLTNSTFCLRVTASSLADPISCLISCLATACGPLHFGAQEAAFRTMMAVRVPENAPALIERVKKGEHRLHGLGHRSYNVVDPRIGPVRDLLTEIGTEKIPYLKVAEEIDRITSTDEYFVKRHLKPNADLYAQFFYVALGWGPEWSPILTFVQRLPGFMAHWRRFMRDDIGLLRPTDLYVGTTEPNKHDTSPKL